MDCNTQTRVFRGNPLLRTALSVAEHEGQTDGLGYTVDTVRFGRGFSSREYSSKQLPHGRAVLCVTFYPGPFDGLAGYPAEITSRYSVWVGWEPYSPESEELYQAPPLPLPQHATGWSDNAWDGPRNWFAEFDNPEFAEDYAASLPPLRADERVPPLTRS